MKIGRFDFDSEDVYICAELGTNHNGDMGIARQLIDIAAECGCDAVKFQKRDPDIAVPEHQKDIPRETPRGLVSYLEYKHKIEFSVEQIADLANHAVSRNIGLVRIVLGRAVDPGDARARTGRTQAGIRELDRHPADRGIRRERAADYLGQRHEYDERS